MRLRRSNTHIGTVTEVLLGGGGILGGAEEEDYDDDGDDGDYGDYGDGRGEAKGNRTGVTPPSSRLTALARQREAAAGGAGSLDLHVNDPPGDPERRASNDDHADVSSSDGKRRKGKAGRGQAHAQGGEVVGVQERCGELPPGVLLEVEQEATLQPLSVQVSVCVCACVCVFSPVS